MKARDKVMRNGEGESKCNSDVVQEQDRHFFGFREKENLDLAHFY